MPLPGDHSRHPSLERVGRACERHRHENVGQVASQDGSASDGRGDDEGDPKPTAAAWGGAVAIDKGPVPVSGAKDAGT